MKKIFSLLLSVLLIMSFFGVNTYAEVNKTDSVEIHLKDVDDWNELAKNCELNTYSNNVVVYLDNDISFAGEEFKPLGYFNGRFEGQNHLLTDITYEPNSINNGVIRYTCKNSVIRNLSVTYTITSTSDRIGFVGYNEGKLTNINVNGTLDGNGISGLICGYNSTTGVISECNSEGTIVGKNYTGGIVGTNYGKIENCANRAHVNTTTDDSTIDIKSLTIETITNSENAATVTDTGGIAGTNFGTIISCTNYSSVGYPHVGYNVGGIAGSQSGYMFGCTNSGEVYGRKEVGGIAGQQEPCLMIKYATSYVKLMKNQLTKIKETCDMFNESLYTLGDDTVSASQGMSTNLEEALNAIQVILNTDNYKPSYDNGEITIDATQEVIDARTTLSSSLTKFFDYWNDVNKSNSGTTDEISSELDDLNTQVNDFGNTAIDTVDYYTSDRDLYVDVSDKDDDSQTNGKVKNCLNYGYVEADINAGGIIGAVAKENNLDPEDDFDISGTATENFTYEMRAVVDLCTNEGRVTATKNYAGGIVGNETIGLIKNCINYGLVDSEDADYVGGIVGCAIAGLKNNYAKCFIWGANYVGGIAGTAIKAEGNGSLAQIVSATSNVGSIFGNYGEIEDQTVEESTEITGNWYVYDDYAAIDGISYDKMAYQISEEELSSMEIDASLKKVNVYFVNDGTVVKKYVINYGESLDPSIVPNNINDGDNYGYWDGYSDEKLTNITRDLLFTNELESIRPSISSDEDLAYVVAEGTFSKGDSVTVINIADGPKEKYEGYAYELEFSISENSNIQRLRLYGFGYDNYDVYVKENGTWTKAEHETDGSYAIIDYSDSYEAYAIVKVNNYASLIYIGIGLIAAGGVTTFIIKKKKKK